MTARDEVLWRIRSAVAGAPEIRELRREYRVAGDGAGSIPLFVERVEDYRAAVHQVPPGDVAATIARLARGRAVVPAGVPAEWLGALDVLRDAPPLTALELDAADAVVTTCSVAIAETGTVVLDGGSGQGRRALTLVPDHHVVVVRVDQVVPGVPEALARLDPRRPQTWISGPSATSDIELQRVEGVHGPRRLDVVVVVGGDPPAGCVRSC